MQHSVTVFGDGAGLLIRMMYVNIFCFIRLPMLNMGLESYKRDGVETVGQQDLCPKHFGCLFAQREEEVELYILSLVM